MRTCPKCKKNLPWEAFSLSRFRKSGRACYCRTCDKVRKAARYSANPEREKEKGRKRMSCWRNASPENWEKARLQSLKWHRANKEKTSKHAREWKKNNPEKAKAIGADFKLRRNYGITLEHYNYLLASQNGVCLICARKNVGGRRLAVDHCHATRKIRGLLCAPCNTALGAMRDSPSQLRRAAEYLENAKNKN